MSLKAKKTLSLLAVIAVAIMIFLFSAQPGEDSAKLSGGITEALLTTMVPDYPSMSEEEKRPYEESAELAVRKAAHFSEFALLALTLVWHMYYVRPRFGPGRLLLWAWIIATLYAGTDELHQMFVDARGPALMDVGIDSLGALAGAFAASRAARRWRMTGAAK